MRPPLEPIYRAGRARYGIDRCAPQRRAIVAGKIEFHALTHGHYPGRSIARSVLPGLNSIGWWNAAEPQDWGLEPHRNEGIEIVFLETGSTAFAADDRLHALHAGQFTVTRPWQLHKLGDPNIGPGRLHWLILDVGVRRPSQEWRWPRWVMLTPPDLAALTRMLRRNEHPVWTATPEIARAFRQLAATVLTYGERGAVSRLIIQLNALLLGMLDALRTQQHREDAALVSRRRTVELFLRDLAQNPASASGPWTLARMAAHCGLGVTAFSEHCRASVNAGAVEYLNHCRLDAAARRLRAEPRTPVTRIALECGFNSSQYFATRFLRRFRCSPRAYRRTR